METEGIRTELDTEDSAGVQPKPAAIEIELELSMPFAAVLKSIFQSGGESAVREMVDEILSRRGTSSAPAGEQTALKAAMDELENDPSDEADKILNIIFSCYDAAQLAREKKYPDKRGRLIRDLAADREKVTMELVADIAKMRENGAFDRDDDDTWGHCDINGDPWSARETDDTPKRPDCDD